ncbi:MAG: DUF262 domain-containing protein [Rhizobiaceae bacterium]|nr:MAG: DUF262 domain-containing protein [Rhizobiaceae bacterium]
MNDFRVTSLSSPENGVWRLFKARERIQTDPSYQRPSDIWTKNKKQMLIDTILNGFDVPKIYFHRFPGSKEIDGTIYDYAIIDGKQRLEAIFDFVAGKFSLAKDFEYFNDPQVSAGGMNYSALAKNYPDLKTDFDSYTLSIVAIEADDDEIIEDLFSRLNEAVPLSAAEKRNALGGPVPQAIRRMATVSFFADKIPFSNSRYRHYNLAAMFMINIAAEEVVDTKKAYLDDFVRNWKSKTKEDFSHIENEAADTLEKLSTVFDDDDDLLRQVSMIIIYFHAYRIALKEGWSDQFERHKLVEFDNVRKANRLAAEEDLTDADYDLLEFDRYAQSPNDAYAVKLRLGTFLEKTFGIEKTVEEL